MRILTPSGGHAREGTALESVQPTDNYIYIPSIRLPHVEMAELILYCVFPLKMITGTAGGIWSWSVPGSGIANPVGGIFGHLPKEVGLYNTHDVSTRPDDIIKW